MPKEDYIRPSIVHSGVSIFTEALGILICLNCLYTPDMMPIIKFSVKFCIGFDGFKALTSLFTIICFYLDITYNNKKTYLWIVGSINGFSVLISIIMIIFYEYNYYNTYMADSPWLAWSYYPGIILYGLMKLLVFGTGSCCLLLYITKIEKQKYKVS